MIIVLKALALYIPSRIDGWQEFDEEIPLGGNKCVWKNETIKKWVLKEHDSH
jgi:hypothetical protein